MSPLTTSIFIRAYHKDFPWLFNNLRSIDRFCTGYLEVIIHVDPQDVDALKPNLPPNVKLVSSGPFCERGYINQQIVKLHADLWCSGDLICFHDADCLFTRPNTPELALQDGKPFVIYTPYEFVGDAKCWQAPTEKCLRNIVPVEFMRRFPLTYRASTLKNLRNWFATTARGPIEAYVAKQAAFSEFNVIGAFANQHEQEQYVWLDSRKDPMPEPHVRQFWSHGGVKASQSEINEILTR